MRLEAIRKPESHEAGCPACGSAVHRRPFGEMYAGSFVQDGQRVEIRRAPDPGLQNPIVLDAITQYWDGGLYRLFPSTKYFTRGGKFLHRRVWAAAFGDIPSGCEIHHRDSNPANNAIENLECIARGEHRSLTWHANADMHRSRGIGDLARERAAEWHRSDEGRLWHKRHAERTKGWTKWQRVNTPCPQCGVEFACLVRKNGHSQKYCSENCKMAHYRARKAVARKSGRLVPDGS